MYTLHFILCVPLVSCKDYLAPIKLVKSWSTDLFCPSRKGNVAETFGWEGEQTKAAGLDSVTEFQIKTFSGKQDSSGSVRVPEWPAENPDDDFGALIALWCEEGPGVWRVGEGDFTAVTDSAKWLLRKPGQLFTLSPGYMALDKLLPLWPD